MTPAQTLFKQLLNEYPDCMACDQPATTIRENYTLPYGMDEKGNTRGLDDWLNLYASSDKNLPDLVGACDAHWNWRRSPSRGWFDPTESIPRTVSGNWIKKRKADKAEAREALIAALGGQCQVCFQSGSPENMRVRVPERSRLDFGITDRGEWYRFVASRPALLKQATLLCIGCELPGTASNPRTVGNRERVIAGYGGECWHPDCDERDGLLVVALKGTAPLRWPNGDKYNSAAKCAYLVRHGFPEGWSISCPNHQSPLRNR